jgi:CheY-like chemotaxis protein
VLLVVDDEPPVLAITDRLARRFGFTVITRTDSVAALAELPALEPDGGMVDLGWRLVAPGSGIRAGNHHFDDSLETRTDQPVIARSADCAVVHTSRRHRHAMLLR